MCFGWHLWDVTHLTKISLMLQRCTKKNWYDIETTIKANTVTLIEYLLCQLHPDQRLEIRRPVKAGCGYYFPSWMKEILSVFDCNEEASLNIAHSGSWLSWLRAQLVTVKWRKFLSVNINSSAFCPNDFESKMIIFATVEFQELWPSLSYMHFFCSMPPYYTFGLLSLSMFYRKFEVSVTSYQHHTSEMLLTAPMRHCSVAQTCCLMNNLHRPSWQNSATYVLLALACSLTS